MGGRLIWVSIHGVILIVGLTVFSFGSGYWGILIALTPSAYVLVLYPDDSENAPKVVVVSHLVALLIGWAVSIVLAHGISPTSIEPMSEAGIRVVGAVLLAFVGCFAFFNALQHYHLMAYVTVFTAAIGVFPSGRALVVVVLAILFVAGVQALRRMLGPETETTSGALVGEFSESAKRR